MIRWVSAQAYQDRLEPREWRRITATFTLVALPLFFFLPSALGVLLAAAILGDAFNFTIGKFFGEKLFYNPNSKIFKQEYLAKTHAFYDKYGGKTIILARFVPIVRTFAPFVAGMGKMHYGRFIRYNIIGGLLWVVLLTYLGYGFGNLPVVKDNFGKVAIGIIFVSVLPIAIEMFRAKFGARQGQSS